MRSIGASLVFRHDDGPVQGFTTLHADRDKTDDRRVIRELLQNSLDACSDGTCEVRMELTSVPLKEIPFIETYRSAFDASAQYREANEPPTGRQVIQRIRDRLADDQTQCLVCADNGSGIGPKELRSLYGSGASTKTEGSRGSVGHGHLTAFAPSDFRYVLYAGRRKNGDETFGGQAILSSHEGDQGLRSADGFVREDTEGQAQQRLFADERGGRQVPMLLQRRLGNGAGSVVMILGYKPIEETAPVPLILGAAAQHFLVAISTSELILRLTDRAGAKHTLDHNSALRRAIDGIGSTREKNKALRSLKTLEEGSLHEEPGSLQGVRIWFRRSIDDDEGRRPRVSIFRDGMWIVDNLTNYFQPSKFARKVPFDAVVDLDSRLEGSFGALVRDAEGASHQDIRPNELSDADSQERLRTLLKGLRRFLEEQADDIDDQVEDYLPPELMLMGGAINRVNSRTRRTTQLDEEGSEQDEAPTPVPDETDHPVNRNGKGGGSARENVQSRVKPGNNAGFRTSCRPDHRQPGRFHIRWEITDDQRLSGDLGLRLCVPSGTDRTSRDQKRATYLNIRSARSDRTTLARDESGREVRIPIRAESIRGGTVVVDVSDVARADAGLVQAELVRRQVARSSSGKKPKS